jgi:(1->4)-alpha-D-glucan 1-alpha-D-glucosylmutase
MNDYSDCIHKVLPAEARVPLSTYRVQMHAGFSFAEARAILTYLKKLGIGDFYSSPIFEARTGSMHGYDVTRHDRLNPELGGDEGFARFSSEIQRLGLGLLLDIVPNHMGVGNDAIWWQDVLENGHASRYAEYFDIDWNPLKPALINKLLLPILGNQYGIELESKRIQVAVEEGRPLIRYYDHTIPLSPRSLPLLFLERDDAIHGVPRGFRDLLDQLAPIPPHETTDDSQRSLRREQLGELLPKIREALRSAEMQPALRRTIESINGIEGDPRSFDHLHKLLDVQPYRLASWRTSAEEVNYRRFFDINDLAGLRMENPAVFAATHVLIRSLLARRDITGVRIDHCDGMLNPRQYLIRLQLLYLASQCSGENPQGETATNGIERGILDPVRGFEWSKSQGPLYAVVEKILEPWEHLPTAWPVHGTSGYDFTYLANEVFIQSENEKHFDALYTQILGHPSDPDMIVYRSKLQVMQTSLASEVYALTNLLSRIAAANRYARDFTDNILEIALRETIACFPVYRTYIDDRGEYGAGDVAFIRYAIARAKRLNPDLDASAFDFLRDTLLLKTAPVETHRQKPDPRVLYFALKFQQLTGPVAAKGVEDTTFYVYNRFISSNEVGGTAKSFGISIETFHQSNQDRLKYSPGTMIATSTHDTKRSEDVRNRLNVLSEMPKTWASTVYRWRRTNAKFKGALEDGRVAPDANEEYLLYQTIVGAWPWRMETEEEWENFVERIKQYASKALSEAKVNLSWINPDPVYMAAVHSFIAAIMPAGPHRRKSAFVLSLRQLLPRLRLFGAINSLAAVVLKVASPGVPDFYQGSELWNLALVDPDNRRPVDFDLRSRYLDGMIAHAAAEGERAVCREVLGSLADGRAKLWTTHRSLDLRKREEAIFRRGEYIPLTVMAPGGTSRQGPANQENVIAFLRRDSATGRSILAAVPRFSLSLMQGKAELPLGKAWAGTRLALPRQAGRRYLSAFTGEALRLEEDGGLALSNLFASFPVALLLSEE